MNDQIDVDGLTEQLSALLDSPDGMERVRQMAQSLLSGEADAPEGANPGDRPENHDDAPAESPEREAPPKPPPDGLPAEELAMLVKASKLLQGNREDDRTRLLLALKPHLSPPRRQKVDQAVRMLQFFRLAPLFKDSGLFRL